MRAECRIGMRTMPPTASTPAAPSVPRKQPTTMRRRRGRIASTGAPGRLVAVDGAAVDAILLRRRRIVVGCLRGTDDAAGVEAIGGIVRMPIRHSARIAGPPEEAA